jgi:hypothetical protein
LFAAVEIATCVTFAVLLVRRRAAWVPRRLGREQTLMVLLALVELGPIFFYNVAYDRFYMQVVAPLAPVVAALVSREWGRHPAARTWAVAAVVFCLGYYAVGESDYLAWHQARMAAAHIAYQTYRPWQVRAGFEEEANSVYIPATDDPTRTLPGAVDVCPKAYLQWTSQSDPRPGANFNSLFPGRIVVVRSSCP